MITHRPARSLSRRTVLAGVAGGSLGVALAARSNHVIAQDATPIADPDAVTVQRDVAYGDVDRESQLLDVYLPPAGGDPRPAVVLFHGGAWMYGISGRADMDVPARALAAAGYVAVNVEYRRTGDPAGAYLWPDQLDDAQRAVRWVRANADSYGVDPERVGAYGHSAGAHLASMLGVRETRDDTDAALAGISSRVSSVVALAGHFDLTIPYPQQFDRDSVTALLGGTVEEVPDAYSDASPVTWVDADASPFLIIHGGADDMNPPVQARTMVDALHGAAIDVIYAELARGDHFTVAEWPIAGPWALTFLDVSLRPDV
jgi:acetyl esterase/lipase